MKCILPIDRKWEISTLLSLIFLKFMAKSPTFSNFRQLNPKCLFALCEKSKSSSEGNKSQTSATAGWPHEIGRAMKLAANSLPKIHLS
jgi:hypothetical protein